MYKLNFFIENSDCSKLIIRIKNLEPKKTAFLSMEHFFTAEVKAEVSDIIREYNNLKDRTNISPKDLEQLKKAVLELLHSETESAVKVFELIGMSPEVYDLGAKTQDEHKAQLWTRCLTEQF